MKDIEIDFADTPELDATFFKNATLRMPEPKKSISLHLDGDVLDWYKKQGTGYQTRMNAVLRMYMQTKTGDAQKVPSRRKSKSGKKTAT